MTLAADPSSGHIFRRCRQCKNLFEIATKGRLHNNRQICSDECGAVRRKEYLRSYWAKHKDEYNLRRRYREKD